MRLSRGQWAGEAYKAKAPAKMDTRSFACALLTDASCNTGIGESLDLQQMPPGPSARTRRPPRVFQPPPAYQTPRRSQRHAAALHQGRLRPRHAQHSATQRVHLGLATPISAWTPDRGLSRNAIDWFAHGKPQWPEPASVSDLDTHEDGPI